LPDLLVSLRMQPREDGLADLRLVALPVRLEQRDAVAAAHEEAARKVLDPAARGKEALRVAVVVRTRL
jgi:hypothetical protein